MQNNESPFEFFYVSPWQGQTFYEMNTSDYPNSNYSLVITVFDSFGLVESSSISISISNVVIHTLGSPITQNPLNDSEVSGLIIVSWFESVDSQGHTVYYDLYIGEYCCSLTDQNSYNVTSLTNQSVQFDTNRVKNGFYFINIASRDTFGLYEEYWSYITIKNGNTSEHTLSKPVITSHSNNEEISGIVKIEYNQSVDSLGHIINYNVTIKSSNGTVVYSTTTPSLSELIDTTVINNGLYEVIILAFDNFGLQSEPFVINVSVNNQDSSETSSSDSTPTSTSGNTITTSPAFEVLLVFSSFIAILILRKKKFT
jgi:hypothetical protein